jgi:hypothetical protein
MEWFTVNTIWVDEIQGVVDSYMICKHRIFYCCDSLGSKEHSIH